VQDDSDLDEEERQWRAEERDRRDGDRVAKEKEELKSMGSLRSEQTMIQEWKERQRKRAKKKAAAGYDSDDDPDDSEDEEENEAMEAMIERRLERIRVRKFYRGKIHVLRDFRRDRLVRAVRAHCPSRLWIGVYGRDKVFGLKRTRRILETSFRTAVKKHHMAIYTKYGMVYVTTDAVNDVLASSKVAGAENHEPYVDPDELYDPDAEDQEEAALAAAGSPGGGEGGNDAAVDGEAPADGAATAAAEGEGEGGEAAVPKGSGRTPADYRKLGDFTRVIFPRFSAERVPAAAAKALLEVEGQRQHVGMLHRTSLDPVRTVIAIIVRLQVRYRFISISPFPRCRYLHHHRPLTSVSRMPVPPAVLAQSHPRAQGLGPPSPRAGAPPTRPPQPPPTPLF